MELFVISIIIEKANLEDLQLLHQIQIESFKPLLKKYQDHDLSPGNESIEQIIIKYQQDFTAYWLIKKDEALVGGVRVVTKGKEMYRVSPIFILPSEQGKGIAQETFRLLEAYYQDARLWLLDTILEEAGNCHLYEKLGYIKTGKIEKIKDGMTIVFYQKHI